MAALDALDRLRWIEESAAELVRTAETGPKGERVVDPVALAVLRSALEAKWH